ncbi:MAG: tRNA dihydrouridine synthase DusB [Gammaproteobacteria bacterium]|nr:tRNA dihydrouridine synthase DusB [Gammaproteobacteria bacterium]
MRIGEFPIALPLILAPMVGVSDSPFREICTELGAGLTVAEMLTSNISRWGNDKNRLRQVKPRIDGPQIVQIAGSDPGLMSEAAILNRAMGADIIDINMGCPAKKVLRKAAGSALLKDPVQVDKILRAVTAAIDIPVTLKIRTGWCPESRNGVEIARLAEQAGIAMLVVHGRTRQCRFKGNAEYDTIAQIKQAVNIPVIANGDICTPEKAKFVLNYTGVDGLMIGRSAQGRPWIFQEIAHFLATGEQLPGKSTLELFNIVDSHLRKIYSLYGEFKGVLFARKHVSSYMKNIPHNLGMNLQDAPPFLRAFNCCITPQEQLDKLQNHFDFLHKNNSRGLAA